MGKKKTSTPKKISQKEKLQKELTKLIKDIDEEGLLFLIQQANTIRYNMQVDELNQRADEIKEEMSKINKSKNKKTKSKKEIISDLDVSVEKGSFDKNYILVIENTRKLITDKEMLNLVKVCHSVNNEAEGARRVYNWLLKFRDDVLLDVGIGQNNFIKLKSVYHCLRNTFAIKEN
jgi:hypothetical protein